MTREYAKRQAPADFLQVRNQIGGIQKLAKHYRCCAKVIARWIKEAGVPPLTAGRGAYPEHDRRPVPDDFAVIAPAMSFQRLKAHYGCGYATLTRWLRETGITHGKPAPKQGKIKPFVVARHPGYANLALFKTADAEDLAADTLRKFGAVFRCDERGRADHKGKLWRFGNVVLTGDELIARAERKAA